MVAWGTILFYAFTEINKLMDFEGVKETLSYSAIYRDQVKQSFIEEVQSRRETRYKNITVNFRQNNITDATLRTGSIAGYAGYSPVFQPRRVNSVCQPNSRRCKSFPFSE